MAQPARIATPPANPAPNVDIAAIAKGATVAKTPELPPNVPQRRALDLAPFVELVTKAKEDGNRYDLPGRFSVVAYQGRKHACEAQTVITYLHAAARQIGLKVAVRRVQASEKDTALTFKVLDK